MRRGRIYMIVLFVCIFSALFSAGTVLAATGAEETAGVSDAGDFVSSGSRKMDYDGAKKALIKAVQNYKSSVDLEPYYFPRSKMYDLLVDVRDSYPQYFDWNEGMIYFADSEKKLLGKLELKYDYSAAKGKAMRGEYEEKVAEILSYADAGWSDFEKVLFVTEYLVEHCDYSAGEPLDFTAYGALIGKEAACEGYTMAFKDLATRLGVPCEKVTTLDLLFSHAWNLVKVGDSWYHLDVTWIDQDDAYNAGFVSFKYFLKSSAWFTSAEGDHRAQEYFFSGGTDMEMADDKRFDSSPWADDLTPFVYYNGFWYRLTEVESDTARIDRYKGCSSGLTPDGCVRELAVRCSDVEEVHWDRSFDWWIFSYYTGFASYGKYLCYSTFWDVYVVDAESGAEQLVYSLPAAEREAGYINGITIDTGGTLHYFLATGYEGVHLGEWKSVRVHTHAYLSKVTKKATCTAAGTKKYTCGDCGQTYSQALAKKAHTPGKEKVTKAATFTSKGQKKVYCKVCGKAYTTKSIAKKKCKKNQVYTVGSYKYRIVNAKTNGKGTVAFAGLAKSVKKVTVAASVKILGAKFSVVQIADKALKNQKKITSVTIGVNVTAIGKEAFSGDAKLATITVKSSKLTKVGKNALKNIYKKAKIKVPKARLAKYRTLFKNKGQKNTVKVVK